nr:hypothetical protein [Moorena sp. SIO1F2]
MNKVTWAAIANNKGIWKSLITLGYTKQVLMATHKYRQISAQLSA